jgi:hypothetical protein
MAQTHVFGPLLESTSVVSIHAGSRAGANGFERPVTLSVVRPEIARDREFCRAFVGAAGCFASISNSGTQRVEDVADEEGRLFAVSPAMDGGTLARVVDCPSSAAKAVSPELACRVVRAAAEAAAGAAAALGEGRALGGLSAESVWVTGSGEVLIMPIAACASRVPARFRRPGVGRYRAPELDRSKTLAPPADVYSLGLLLWDLLSHGRAPSSDVDVATRAGGSVVDARVVRLVMRCLSPAPEERPVNASALAIELAKAVRGAASICNADIARAFAPRRGPGNARTRESPSDTIEIRTEELKCMAPSMDYDVAHAPVRHVSDFAKSVRPAVPRPRGPGLAKTHPKGFTFEPRLIGTDGSWLRLAGRMGRWVVGRGHSADLVTLDPDMSRQHFEVVLGSDGSFRVRDLGSKNGLFVNGSRARSAPLRAGDELRAGGTVLRFEV